MQPWKRLLRLMRWQVLFVSCFGIYLLLYGYSLRTLDAYSGAGERLQQSFLLELAQRQERLQELATSPQLRHALEHQLEQLVVGELRASLQDGTLEFLMLANRSCNALYMQKLAPGQYHGCAEVMALDFNGPGNHVLRLENTVYQFAEIPSLSDRYLVSGLQVDNAWLNKYKAPLEIPEDLAFSDGKIAIAKLKYLPTAPSLGGNVHESLPLIVTSDKKSLLLTFAASMQAHHGQVVLNLTFLILLLACWQLYLLLRVSRSFARDISPAVQEIGQMLSIEASDPLATLGKETFGVQLKEILRRLRELLVQRDEQLLDLRAQLRHSQDGVQLAQAKLRQLRTESDQFRDRGAQQILSDFLLKDLRRMAAEAAMTIVLVRSRLDRMQNRSMAPVARLLRDWQMGIAERGARKMLRSLAETLDVESSRPILEIQVDQFIACQDSLLLESQAATRGVSSSLAMQARIQALGAFLELTLRPVALSVKQFNALNLELANYFNGMKPKALQIDFSDTNGGAAAANVLYTQAFPVCLYTYYYFFLYREHLLSGELQHRMEFVNGQMIHEFSCECSPKLATAIGLGHSSDVIWLKLLDLCEINQIDLQIAPQKFGKVLIRATETLQEKSFAPLGQNPAHPTQIRQ